MVGATDESGRRFNQVESLTRGGPWWTTKIVSLPQRSCRRCSSDSKASSWSAAVASALVESGA